MRLGFGRRKDDESGSPFGGNARGTGDATSRGRVRTHEPRSTDPPAGGEAPARIAPGPNARAVTRLRIVAAVGWSLAFLMGLALAVVPETGAAVFGLVWMLVIGSLFALLLRNRVVVDDHLLYVRTLRGWEPPVDLTRLRSAAVVTGTNLAQWVVLTDRRGNRARIDAVNRSLRRLYRELAVHIGPWEDTADDRLQRRIGRYR